jgi:HD-GYP domain-containing protein (c-di-GMP phosphodiesterase class II)
LEGASEFVRAGSEVVQRKVILSAVLIGLGVTGVVCAAILAKQGSMASAVFLSVASLAVGAALTLTFVKPEARALSGLEMSEMREHAVVEASQKYERMIERLNSGLEIEVGERLRQGLATRHALIMGLAKLADYRDGETGAHLERLRDYSELLAREMSDEFEEIDDEWIQCLRLAAVLHDIGKVGVPDHVLLKPGRLTPEERKVINRHVEIGADTLIGIRRSYGDDAMINMGIQVTLQHHERWDGNGYPFGIAGDSISLAARVVALADFYDALTTERVYKKAYSHEETCEMIREARGTHFDPIVVDTFNRVSDQFNTIRCNLSGEALDGSMRGVA